ncbi:hypothetical protein [Jannaschia sp. M317]|uniref:hypothetical protein n=1 Tax=Jannaschia sp. M317 TaxID=2867011 RepID=UPI0021A79568|nr:hypothetical protein [Jannaschia sp. M317]UWQ16353.1 hypothetical protein K3551_10480 [Jannaschia sp. M317]
MTNALNKHAEVALEGEPYQPVFVNTLRFFEQVSQSLATQTPPFWNDQRPMLFLNMIRAGQKHEQHPGFSVAHHVGFKLPRLEQHWEPLQAILGPYTFVYCLRPFPSHWLSVCNRWPGHSIAEMAALYLQSIRAAQAMQASDRVNLVAFGLEPMSKSPRDHLTDVGQAIGLSAPADWARRVNAAKKANATEKFNDAPRLELNEAERDFLNRHPNILRAYDDFWGGVPIA